MKKETEQYFLFNSQETGPQGPDGRLLCEYITLGISFLLEGWSDENEGWMKMIREWKEKEEKIIIKSSELFLWRIRRERAVAGNTHRTTCCIFTTWCFNNASCVLWLLQVLLERKKLKEIFSEFFLLPTWRKTASYYLLARIYWKLLFNFFYCTLFRTSKIRKILPYTLTSCSNAAAVFVCKMCPNVIVKMEKSLRQRNSCKIVKALCLPLPGRSLLCNTRMRLASSKFPDKNGLSHFWGI